jgi:hypothetical protein
VEKKMRRREFLENRHRKPEIKALLPIGCPFTRPLPLMFLRVSRMALRWRRSGELASALSSAGEVRRLFRHSTGSLESP